MTVSTQGLALNSGSRAWRSAVELLSSMRFSISLLTVICIASVIGTVLKQHEPLNNYVNQFGPFWTEVFGMVSLYNVYSAWWFLLILAFLVTSTSLCVVRNTPKILADLKSYKENIREQSLQAFGQRAQMVLAESAEPAAHRIGNLLVSGGWRVKLQRRETSQGPGWMVAAKAGAANKLGYIAAHSAIVLVCLGGLLDGDLIVRAQMLFNGKQVYKGGGLIADVPQQHRLGERNPTFRGNLLVAEGTQSSTAILNQSDGVLLQDLPFAIELKKFIVEYYSTGMPKLFASDIVIHDKATGERIEARTEVNHPVKYRGIEIFQSSFDDGGSSLRLRAQSLTGRTQPFDLNGIVGGSSQLTNEAGAPGDQLTVEYTGLRVINVENFGGNPAEGIDVRKVDLRDAMNAQMGAANKTKEQKNLRNVGPSVTYKLRDGAGQAREYHNYMLPVDMGEGVPVFLLGMRETPADTFRYIRVPADEKGSKAGEVLVRILNGVLFELEQVAREQAGLPAFAPDARGQAFMTQAVLALSDVPLYPAPLVLTLADFTQVQASVFQVARAPGKTVVYLGCALLILGVFAMLYVRERRVWVWLAPGQDSATSQATMAFSTNRKTLDSDKEFEHLKARLLAWKE